MITVRRSTLIRMTTSRASTIAALALLVGTLSGPAAASSGSSGTLRLSGRVPPHAFVRLSNWTLSPVALRRMAGGVRLGVANLSILANNRRFSVSLVSAGARSAGRPSLVDPVSGMSMPYQVSYDGATLAPVAGEIPLDRLLAAVGATGPKDLEVTLPEGSATGAGRYQDRLVLVIKAR